MREKFRIVIFAICLALSSPGSAIADPPTALSDQEPPAESAGAPSGIPADPGASKYLGNIDSMKFHLANCEFAVIMNKKRKIPFQHYRQAKEAGMKPCNWCLPRYSLRVDGRLLRPDPHAKSLSVE